jgi:STAM-binding protein
MSQHQQTQGYTPSLLSMFKNAPSPNLPDQSTLLSVTSDIYSRDLLPTAAHASTFRPSPYPEPQPDTRIVRTIDAGRELRTVTLPRDCLPRFLSIAKINTERNRETCGLLLGKDKGHKYVVTTLLIPKQHSTSDTCTMDEEELVLQFTEERNLITLGWVCCVFFFEGVQINHKRLEIHTHPSQSCFMSSVDLHTHSGFQRMLPESFAVVCAPKHTPKQVDTSFPLIVIR